MVASIENNNADRQDRCASHYDCHQFSKINTVSKSPNTSKGLEKDLRGEPESITNQSTRDNFEETRDDVESVHAIPEGNLAPKSSFERLYCLSEKRQIEGKKIRNDIQNKKHSDAFAEEIDSALSRPAKSCSTQKNSEVCEWLYRLSFERQMDGKKKRQSIEEKLTKRPVTRNRPKVPIKFDVNGIVDLPKSMPFDLSKLDDSPIVHRLTHCSHSAKMKEEGRKKKESVEAVLKSRHPEPKTYPKLPPSMHSHYYEKSVKYAKEREERIHSLIQERDEKKKMQLEHQRKLKAERERKRREMYGATIAQRG